VLKQLKRIFKDTAIYSLGSLLPKAAGIILAPIYTTFLSPSDYGVYSLAAMITSMVSVVMVLGQDGSLTLFYRSQRNEGEDPRELLFTVFVFVLGFASLVFGVMAILGPIYTPWLSKDPAFTFVPYVAIALFTSWVTVPLSLQQAVNRAKGQAKLHTAFQVAQFTINTAFTLLFVVAFRQGAIGSLKGTFLGAALVSPFAIWMLVRQWKPQFSRTALKRSLDFGLPLVPHYFLGGFLLTFADRLMLSRYASLAAVGLYSFAYNLSMMLNLVSQSINRAWGPIYYDLADTEEGRAQLPRLTTVYASVVAIVGIGFTLYMPDVLVILANERFWPAASIMPILVGGYFFFAMYMVTSTPIFFARKTRWIPILSGSAAVFNIGINFYLIPTFGIQGAAWATFAAYVLMAAGARWLSSKVGGLFEDRRLAAVVAIYLIGFASTFAIQSFTRPGIEGGMAIAFDIAIKAAAFLAILGLFPLFRVVTPAEIGRLVDRVRARRRAKPEERPIEEEASLEARDVAEISATSDATGFEPDDER